MARNQKCLHRHILNHTLIDMTLLDANLESGIDIEEL